MDELDQLWPLGVDADLFLNKVSACRVQQIARRCVCFVLFVLFCFVCVVVVAGLVVCFVLFRFVLFCLFILFACFVLFVWLVGWLVCCLWLFVCGCCCVLPFLMFVVRSYNVTALAVHLFDSTYAGVLHPLEFSIKPMEWAPGQVDGEVTNWPQWMSSYIEELEAEEGEDGDVRMAGYMQGVLIVSLGGASKSHLLTFFRKKIIELSPPYCHRVQKEDGTISLRPPVINVLGNFSKIALYAGEHGHIIYDPDEYGLAFMPQKGPKPSGTSASQMMSFPELLNLLTPPKGGGGFEGVTASRRFTYPESLVFVVV